MQSLNTPQSANAKIIVDPLEECLPWISILVPSYEYAAGVDRILTTIASQRPSGIECIVRDDSRSDEVQDIVNAHVRLKDVAGLTYVRSPVPKGAVNNWNALMTMARGEYILLMHHDEAPLGPDFFTNLYQELHADGCTDALILGCMVGRESDGYLRRHVPAAVQSFLMRLLGSGYLLRHNFIGPPSALVIRRSACLTFDNRLTWLVDVDWMNRCMQAYNLRSRVSRRCLVASLQRTGASITSSLGNQVREIERKELEQICAEQSVRSWAALLGRRTGWSSVLARLDLALWLTLKVVIRLLALAARTRNPFFASSPKS